MLKTKSKKTSSNNTSNKESNISKIKQKIKSLSNKTKKQSKKLLPKYTKIRSSNSIVATSSIPSDWSELVTELHIPKNKRFIKRLLEYELPEVFNKNNHRQKIESFIHIKNIKKYIVDINYAKMVGVKDKYLANQINKAVDLVIISIVLIVFYGVSITTLEYWLKRWKDPDTGIRPWYVDEALKCVEEVTLRKIVERLKSTIYWAGLGVIGLGTLIAGMIIATLGFKTDKDFSVKNAADVNGRVFNPFTQAVIRSNGNGNDNGKGVTANKRVNSIWTTTKQNSDEVASLLNKFFKDTGDMIYYNDKEHKTEINLTSIGLYAPNIIFVPDSILFKEHDVYLHVKYTFIQNDESHTTAYYRIYSYLDFERKERLNIKNIIRTIEQKLKEAKEVSDNNKKFKEIQDKEVELSTKLRNVKRVMTIILNEIGYKTSSNTSRIEDPITNFVEGTTRKVNRDIDTIEKFLHDKEFIIYSGEKELDKEQIKEIRKEMIKNIEAKYRYLNQLEVNKKEKSNYKTVNLFGKGIDFNSEKDLISNFKNRLERIKKEIDSLNKLNYNLYYNKIDYDIQVLLREFINANNKGDFKLFLDYEPNERPKPEKTQAINMPQPLMIKAQQQLMIGYR